MFLSQETGEIRSGIDDALSWSVQDDGYGFPCFVHEKTQEVVYEDPRFTYALTDEALQQRKFVMQEIRFLTYICKDLLEEHHKLTMIESTGGGNNGGGQEREMIKFLQKVKNHAKIVQLSGAYLTWTLTSTLSLVHRPSLSSSSWLFFKGFLLRAKALYTPTSIVDQPMDESVKEELDYGQYLVTELTAVQHLGTVTTTPSPLSLIPPLYRLNPLPSVSS